MKQSVDTYFGKFCKFSASLLVLGVAVFVILSPPGWHTFLYANLLSFAFVGSNFLVMRKIDLNDHSKFNYVFGISLGGRFLLALAGIIIILKVINNHQIFFTVSFIISYICHSVIEIIFLNKILQTDTGT